MREILVEALLVGGAAACIHVIAEKIFHAFGFAASAMTTAFITGFLAHLIFEFAGLNQAFCRMIVTA